MKTSVVASKGDSQSNFSGSHLRGSLEEHQLTGLGTIALQVYYQKHFKLRAVFIVGRLDDQVLREVMHLLPPFTADRYSRRAHTAPVPFIDAAP